MRALDARLRAPREAPNVERLRAALEQRAAEWKADLRAEPKIARLMLRRLIDPITLWPLPRPDFIRWEAPTKAVGLLDGIEDAPSIWLASPTAASWNQILPWLRQIDGLRPAA